MKKKIYILLGILFLFSFAFVQAVPPQSLSDTSLDLVSTFPTTHELGQNYSLKVHVFNTATEDLLTSGINCYYHFYTHQISGTSHVSKGEMILDGVDYEATVDGDLINLSGEYSVLEWCNSSTEIGYNKYTFEVTPNGKQFDTQTAISYSGFILIFFFVFGMTLYGAIRIPWNHKRDQNNIVLQANNLRYAKIFLFSMSYMLMMFLFGLSYKLFREADIEGFTNFFYWGYTILQSLLIPILIGTIILFVITFLTNKKITNNIKLGIN